MLVFRDASTERTGPELLRELARLLAGDGEPLAALFLAADLETALEDAESPGAEVARRITDHVADGCVSGGGRALPQALALLRTLVIPARLRTKRPEGHAFYNVHPLRFARGIEAFGNAVRARVRVVGARTIGTSLSACVRAELARHGSDVERFTVRPTGHPWDRRLELGARERELVARARGATFVVVDEGPGLSGSTLLSVAESLVVHGVRHEDIRFLTPHAIVPDRLLAREASVRFAPFRALAAPPWSPPPGALDFSGGEWRPHAAAWDEEWPASWPAHERVKYLDASRLRLHKFSGFAPYGDAVCERAEMLGAAGFSPRVARAEPGFLAYDWLGRRPRVRPRERARVLERVLEYLAFRARELRVGSVDAAPLEAMVRTNVAEVTGHELPATFRLECEWPVLADGRLAPHEWVRAPGGAWLKTDGAEHGDDHFFPGPTDAAWDVAGAITEWQLDAAERSAFCERYRTLTGDDVAGRLWAYLLAYGAWRLGVAGLAREQGEGAERSRWQRDETIYRARLCATLGTGKLARSI